MKTRSIVAVAAAVAVAGALALAPAAFADDIAGTAPVGSQEAVTAPETPPVIAPDTTPPSVVTAPEVAPVVSPDVAVALVAVQPEATVTFHWLTTNTTEPTSVTVNWPQTLVDPAACGTGWVQNDTYLYGTDDHKAVVGHLNDDGFLTETNGTPEDSAVVVSWTFTQQTACPPPKVEVQPCAATGATSYTEDGLPTVTPEGDRYGNPDVNVAAPGHALNRLTPVTGNLQGIVSQSETITAASGYHAAIRIVLNPNAVLNAGGPTVHYASVTAEPYMNGWAAGQTGVFTMTQSTLVWNSKIVNPAPGSQASPVTLAAMGDLMPNNALGAIGIHSASTFAAGQYTTVSALAGCVNLSLVPVIPAPFSTYTVWVDGTFGCGATTVDQTRTRTDHTFAWDQETASYTETTTDVAETGTRALTADEETVCPVVTPTPPVALTAHVLAATGSDDLWSWGTFGVLALIAGLLALLARPIARRVFAKEDTE